MVFAIAYDLISPNDRPEDYQRLIAAVKDEFWTWCHLQKSVWLVESALSASEIRDGLNPILRGGDVLFVARLQGNWASWALGQKKNQWLADRSF